MIFTHPIQKTTNKFQQILNFSLHFGQQQARKQLLKIIKQTETKIFRSKLRKKQGWVVKTNVSRTLKLPFLGSITFMRKLYVQTKATSKKYAFLLDKKLHLPPYLRFHTSCHQFNFQALKYERLSAPQIKTLHLQQNLFISVPTILKSLKMFSSFQNKPLRHSFKDHQILHANLDDTEILLAKDHQYQKYILKVFSITSHHQKLRPSQGIDPHKIFLLHLRLKKSVFDRDKYLLHLKNTLSNLGVNHQKIYLSTDASKATLGIALKLQQHFTTLIPTLSSFHYHRQKQHPTYQKKYQQYTKSWKNYDYHHYAAEADIAYFKKHLLRSYSATFSLSSLLTLLNRPYIIFL